MTLQEWSPTLGTTLTVIIVASSWRRLRSWWKARTVERLLCIAGLSLVAVIPVGLGFIIGNPRAELNASIANEQRRTVIQVVGGLLGAAALLFGGLRARQAELQIRETERQRVSQEKLKFDELLQSRWHNALDLLGKGTDKEPHLESRVAAILMLSSLELCGEKLVQVRHTICHYIRINAQVPQDTQRRADEDEQELLRADLECCCAALRGLSRNNEPARSINMRDIFLPGADLRDCDLREWQLHRAILRNADLRGAKLDGARFCRADLSGAILDNMTSVKGCSFEDCTMAATTAIGVDFSGVNLRGARIGPYADFSDCKLDDSDMEGATVTDTKTTGMGFAKAKGYKQAPSGPSADATSAKTEEELLAESAV